MIGISKYVITKLNGTNYFNWRYKMKMILIEKEVWNVIEDDIPNPVTDAWKKADEKAHSTIALNVEDDQIQYIRLCKQARDAWKALMDIHEKDTANNRVFILRKIMNQRIEEGGDVEAHVIMMNELFQKMSALGGEITQDLIFSATLLGSLPESYDNLITALEARDQELTSSLVCTKVIGEYKRRLERNLDVQGESVSKFSSSAKRGSVFCHFCKEKGHQRRHCKKFTEWLKKNKPKSNKKPDGEANKPGTERTNMIRTVSDKDDDREEFLFTIAEAISGWLLDSGATSHSASDIELFSVIDRSYRERIKVANGQLVDAVGRGTIEMKLLNKSGKITNVKMENVLYAPDLKGNFISVGKLAKSGFTVTFNKKFFEIKYGEKEVAYGEICGNLYKFRTPNQVNGIESDVNSGCVHEWHSVLGHRDIDVVKSLSSGELVDGVTFGKCNTECPKILNCEVCLQGKMARMKFPKKSENRTKGVLHLVHSDLCGAMQTATPSGKKYMVTFIDDFSKYTVIELLREKSETFGKFKEYVEMCKTMFNSRPRFLRTDGGGEYMDNDFVKYMKTEGIQCHRTAPYTPQQNGVAERKNRTLIEMARCMLIESGMAKTFWGEAVIMANYIQNRLPWKNVEKTPYEIWFGTKPSIQHFKKFGSKCFVFVPDEKRRKLDAKAVEAIMVGYDLSSKAYRCYVPSTGKVVISRDVRFVSTDCIWKTSDNVVTVENGSNNRNTADTSNESILDENSGPEMQEIRRSARPNKGVPPKRLIEIMALDSAEVIQPSSYNEAVTCTDKFKWIQAMNDEMSSMYENQAWELVDLPEGRKGIGSKWTFKIKKDASGKIQRYKARLVAQGFSQKFGTDYDEVFAPVAKQVTFKILLAVASAKRMKVKHLDVKTAFLYGTLEEPIYMKQPQGFVAEGQEEKVCLLRRSIYGLKQAGRIWNQLFNKVLIDAKYVQSTNDPCFFTLVIGENVCYVLVHVDDIIAASGDDDMLVNLEKILKSKFEVNNLGDVRSYLGMEIQRNEHGWFGVNQTAYIRKVVNDTGLADAKPSNVPMDVSYRKQIATGDILVSNEQYRSLIGSLLYVSVNTRPDIAASVGILSQKVERPTQEDWNELKRVVKYLKGTANLSLVIGNGNQNEDLIGYADADWAEDRMDRKSVSGHVFKFKGSTIGWKSKKQTVVAMSSAEAEYISLSETCRELIWLRRLLKDFHQLQDNATTVYEDNQSCLKLAQNENLSGRTKHIDTKKYFVKDYIDKGEIFCDFCPTGEMLADMLTKPLPPHLLAKHREACGLKVFK